MASTRIRGITIEIGGDTSKLVSALKSADTAIRTTQSDLNTINRALKFDTTNVELLKDKQIALNDKVAESRDKLEAEKAMLEELKKSDGFDENSEQAKRLKTQIDADTVALKQAEQAVKEFGSVGAQQMQALGAKITEVGTKITAVGDSMMQLGQNLTTYVTLPITAGFTAAIKTTGDFDASMSKVQATAGATAEDMELLREKAKEMGETTKFSASESADALNYMAMAGWKTEDMLNGISGIMNLAAASGEELGTTSDIVTDALTAFGLQADESGRFADILASAASNANTNVSMMGESFKYVAPVAGAMGYSAEDVAVALGLMANAGIKADMAGTSLRNMMQRMAKPTKESANAMERLGIELYNEEGKMYSFREIMEQLRTSMTNINMPLEDYNNALDILDMQLEDGTLTQSKYESALEELNLQAFGAEGAEKARAAAMLGGARAMAGLLAISNATEADYNKLTSAIDNSSQAFAKLADGSVVPLTDALASGQEVIETFNGTAEAMANTMLDNVNGQMTILKSQLEALAISFGELLMPTVRKVVTMVQELVDKLNAMDDAQKETIITVAAIVAAIGPVLLIGGALVKTIGAIVGGIGFIITKIGVLIPFIQGTLLPALQGIGAFITSTLLPAITAIGAPVLAIVAVIGALTAAIIYLWQTNEGFRNTVIEVVESIKTNVLEFIAGLQPIFESVMVLLTALKDFIVAIVTAAVTYVQNILEQNKTKINAVLLAIKVIVETVLVAIKAVVNNTLDTIRNVVKLALDVITGVVKVATALIKGDWESALNAVKETANNILHDVINLFSDWGNNIGEFFSDLIGRFGDWGRDMIDNLVDGIKSRISAVTDAISSVASTIASYIHFSEPDKGALSNFHTYMPDMIESMVNGINNGRPQLENAMANMAKSLVPTNLIDGVGGATTNTVNLTVYGAQGQDVNELADIIQERINSNVYRNGAVFA